MPRRKIVPQKKTAQKPSPKKPRPKALSLLILECDAYKPQSQALAVGDELNSVVRLPAELTVELAFINSEADLKERFIDTLKDTAR